MAGVSRVYSPPRLPVEVAHHESLKRNAGNIVIQGPARGDVADDEHPSALPPRGEVAEESADAGGSLTPALAAGIGLIDELGFVLPPS
jgi:hypothetical protein